jgi:hypothetical protein
MSFYPQPNSYQCGPFALKYALVMLGIFKNEDEIGITAGSTWWGGTDEIGLAKAARKYNVKMKYLQSSNPDDARRMLNQKLKKRIPCVLSVKGWGHWITVVGYSKGKYVVIDSDLDNVISVQTSSQLLRQWRYKDYYDEFISYDAYAIVPKFKIYTRAKFTPAMAKEVMYAKNSNLARKWNEYFDDVISIGKPRTKLTTNFITFSEFLRRNENNLTQSVADWHGMPTYAELRKILHNMKFVADVYDIIIPSEHEKKALIDITSLLMIYSSGKYGMDPIY